MSSCFLSLENHSQLKNHFQSNFLNHNLFLCLFKHVDVMDRPSVYHATVVIFLEFFAWGLLTSPSIAVSNGYTRFYY